MTRLSSNSPLRADEWAVLNAICAWPGATTAQLLRLCSLPEAGTRKIQRALSGLRAHSFVDAIRLPEGHAHHHVPTRRALRRIQELDETIAPSAITTALPMIVHGYHRAQLALAVEERDYRVTRGVDGLAAVRNYLLEHSPSALHAQIHRELATPLDTQARPLEFVYRCPSCGKSAPERFGSHLRLGTRFSCRSRPRRDDVLSYLVAVHASQPPIVLLSDQPNRALERQLSELPVRISTYDAVSRRAQYQARLRVIFLPTEDGSIYDDAARKWFFKGPRLRAFDTLISIGSGSAPARNPKRTSEGPQFPYTRTLKSVMPPRGVFYHRLQRIQTPEESDNA